MGQSEERLKLSSPKEWGFIILRTVIGWYFFYEGFVKLLDSGWSAGSYLSNTHGFLSYVFHAMASNTAVLEIVDFLNIWGLVLAGLAMIMGFMPRTAVFGGILLLFFYYIAYPPFNRYNFGVPQEGNYLFVDKTFIELISLGILALFPQTLNIGLWSLLKKLKINIRLPKVFNRPVPEISVPESTDYTSRRELLKHLTFLPFIGGFAWACSSSKKYASVDASTGSTIRINQQSLSDIEGEMPMGVLYKGKPPVSRLILGSNILSGTAHARDLVYAGSLFRAYNTEKKILETFMLAEQAGINLFSYTPLFKTYKKIYGSKVQTWKNVVPTKDDIYSQVDKAIDEGVDYIFIQGAASDNRVREGDIDVLAKCLEYIKKQGYPAGLGAHSVQVLMACDEYGMDPDFYYKTMHHDRYWSAIPKENRYYPLIWRNHSDDHDEFHDNMWCLFPEMTVDYVQKSKKPVIGFKVLAGGAIHPKDGFQWAFSNGADFIHVGMFDFQIVQDVNLTIKSVAEVQNRQRPWFG